MEEELQITNAELFPPGAADTLHSAGQTTSGRRETSTTAQRYTRYGRGKKKTMQRTPQF